MLFSASSTQKAKWAQLRRLILEVERSKVKVTRPSNAETENAPRGDSRTFYRDGVWLSAPVEIWRWKRRGMRRLQRWVARRPWCWNSSRRARERSPSSGPSRLPGRRSASRRGRASSSRRWCCPRAPSSSSSSSETGRSAPAVCPSPATARAARRRRRINSWTARNVS